MEVYIVITCIVQGSVMIVEPVIETITMYEKAVNEERHGFKKCIYIYIYKYIYILKLRWVYTN